MMMLWRKYISYFKNEPYRDGIIYLVVILVATSYAVTACLALVMNAPDDCNLDPTSPPRISYPNVEFNADDCLDKRYPKLLYMTPRECEQFRQLMFSVLMGALIGYERRSPDRAAGIRTMSVTSLGSCAFTIASMYAFRDGPMAWDASRVSAAIPSGVGFLGSGLIWKGMVGEGTDKLHQVHGLTTAASVWLSAAVGVVCGGGMYLVAFFSVVCAMIVLRFGPRSDAHSWENEPEDEQEEIKLSPDYPTGAAGFEPSRSDPGIIEIDSHLRQRLLNSPSRIRERKKLLQSVLHTHY